jgi:hypothetical protein
VARYDVYGLSLETDFPFSWPLPRSRREPDLWFDCSSRRPFEVEFDELTTVHDVFVDDVPRPPDITYRIGADLDVVSVRDAADHYVTARRISCHLFDPSFAYLVEIQLLGMVLALWLERRGTPALHASVATVGSAAVAFLAEKGAGKTTVATALVAAGHRLLVDDLLAVHAEEDHVLAQAGYPMLRLWPEQVRHFLGEDPETSPDLVHPSYDKRRVPIGAGFGRFHEGPAPLRRIYVPVRIRSGRVRIMPMRPSQALVSVLRHAYLRDAVHGLGLAPGRLRSLAGVIERVPVRMLVYPSGLDRLGEVVHAIESDLEGP